MGELDAPPEGAAPDCSEEPDAADGGELVVVAAPPEPLASPGDDASAAESAGGTAPTDGPAVDGGGDADPVLAAPPVDSPDEGWPDEGWLDESWSDEGWLDEGWSEESGCCWSGVDTSTFGGAPPDCGDTVIGPIRTGPT